jgi:hypothetical protein
MNRLRSPSHCRKTETNHDTISCRECRRDLLYTHGIELRLLSKLYEEELHNATRLLFPVGLSPSTIGRYVPRIGIGGRLATPPPSRRGELHPEPLTDPDMKHSTYPARATH